MRGAASGATRRAARRIDHGLGARRERRAEDRGDTKIVMEEFWRS